MTDFRTIRVAVADDGVATLTLSRPELRNAINLDMVEEVAAALDQLGTDPAVRVLVLRGEGKSFAGGADIGQLRERRSLDAMRAINAGMFQRVEDFPHPVIAAIEGYALGGGCELAMACDIRIAGVTAKLGFPEVGLGIFPAAGGTWRLPRLVGLGKAKELVFTGRVLTADEAMQVGLVEHVVPEGDAESHAGILARQIAANGTLAVRVAKAALNAIARGNDPEPIEKLGQAILFESAEKFERMTAFLERKKRKES
ncbi:enoyl-CoA hydratase/isomerase family protein [Vulgatibacter sp.]|uniref:enoyl-CoA hydratase/isomerase family protein n=1 Tax=Vulgatibacter sp. TaxID=1971226 RepID=UPI0035670833